MSPSLTHPALPLVGSAAVRRQLRALFALTKPRLALMSVLSTMTAFATAAADTNLWLAGQTLAGTAAAAAGALSLNQCWERHTDARMRRTRLRPLPQGELRPATALAFSITMSGLGVGLLLSAVNALAAVLAAAIILLYGVVYTPLKRRTRWATEVGAISGALPALLGNAAAGDLLASPGLLLTALLLFWQMPHFFAIGWRHRDDYRAAGFPLLPVIDADGRRTAQWSFGYTCLLVASSLVPALSSTAGPTYFTAALLAGGGMLWYAWRFLRETTDRDNGSRRLFLASLAYLPFLMTALMLDVWLGR